MLLWTLALPRGLTQRVEVTVTVTVGSGQPVRLYSQSGTCYDTEVTQVYSDQDGGRRGASSSGVQAPRFNHSYDAAATVSKNFDDSVTIITGMASQNQNSADSIHQAATKGYFRDEARCKRLSLLRRLRVAAFVWLSRLRVGIYGSSGSSAARGVLNQKYAFVWLGMLGCRC